MAKYFNITGELTRELLAAGSNTNASSISLANVNSSHTSIVDLYIEKTGVGKFYIQTKLIGFIVKTFKIMN